MKRKLTAMLLAAAMVFCLALTGCNDAGPDGSGGGGSVSGTTASAKFKPAKDSYKIGFVSWSIGHTVPAAWDEGIHTALDGFPQYEYTAFDGEASAETQIRIMSDLISQGYDAIILQASDGAALTSSVEEAEAAGIPVVCLNLDVNCSHTGFVSMAAYEAGYAVAEKMGEQMGGKGNVVIIQGVIGASSQTYREAGFRDAMAALYPDISILDAQPADWDKETAISVMNDFMQSYS